MSHATDPSTLERRRRQTANARQALAAKFPTPEARSAHYSAAGRRGNERRLVLSGDDVVALADAYRTLERIAKKYSIADRSLDPCLGP